MNLLEGIAFILLGTVQGAILADHLVDPTSDLIAGLAVDHEAGQEADPIVGVLEDHISYVSLIGSSSEN